MQSRKREKKDFEPLMDFHCKFLLWVAKTIENYAGAEYVLIKAYVMKQDKGSIDVSIFVGRRMRHTQKAIAMHACICTYIYLSIGSWLHFRLLFTWLNLDWKPFFLQYLFSIGVRSNERSNAGDSHNGLDMTLRSLFIISLTGVGRLAWLK